MNRQDEVDRISFLSDSELLQETLEAGEQLYVDCPESTMSWLDYIWQYDKLKEELKQRLPESFW